MPVVHQFIRKLVDNLELRSSYENQGDPMSGRKNAPPETSSISNHCDGPKHEEVTTERDSIQLALGVSPFRVRIL